jgi:hypothetical protein
MSHTVETPAGKFVVYMGAEAEEAQAHQSLEWYFAPVGWKSGPYSKGYVSAEAAEEACWEESSKPRPSD